MRDGVELPSQGSNARARSLASKCPPRHTRLRQPVRLGHRTLALVMIEMAEPSHGRRSHVTPKETRHEENDLQ